MALQQLVDDATSSALEGLRRQSDGTLLIARILPVVTDNQRHWRLAALGYGFDSQRKEQWRMEQLDPSNATSCTPKFPTLPAVVGPGWKKTTTPGFTSLDMAIEKDSLTVDAGVKISGSGKILHIVRSVSYALYL